MKIKKVAGVLPFQREVARNINKIARNLNRGYVVDSHHIVVEAAGGGRFRLKLHPAIAQRIGV